MWSKGRLAGRFSNATKGHLVELWRIRRLVTRQPLREHAYYIRGAY